MFVEDYMSSHPTTVSVLAPLAEAREIMSQRGLRHLPVLDESRRLVGILSDRDVRFAIGYDERGGAGLQVSEVMTADPVTISGSATLDDALILLQKKRFGSLPVVDGEQLVGILTRSDLLRALFQVLGLDAPGRRVEVALPHGWADLAHAFQALVPCEEEIISAVVSRMRRDGGEPCLYLRVTDLGTLKIEKQLRDAANIVLEPEHP